MIPLEFGTLDYPIDKESRTLSVAEVPVSSGLELLVFCQGTSGPKGTLNALHAKGNAGTELKWTDITGDIAGRGEAPSAYPGFFNGPFTTGLSKQIGDTIQENPVVLLEIIEQSSEPRGYYWNAISYEDEKLSYCKLGYIKLKDVY